MSKAVVDRRDLWRWRVPAATPTLERSYTTPSLAMNSTDPSATQPTATSPEQPAATPELTAQPTSATQPAAPSTEQAAATPELTAQPTSATRPAAPSTEQAAAMPELAAQAPSAATTPPAAGPQADTTTAPPPAPPLSMPPSTPAGGPQSTDRQWAVGLHLSAFLGILIPLPFANLVGPLVIWLIKREGSSIIEKQGREAINFNLTIAVIMTVLVLLSIVSLGIALLLTVPAALVLVLLWIVFPIVAAFKTSESKDYRYPMTIRFI